MTIDGEEYWTEQTEPVGVYEALEILSAEQIKKDQVYVTFSAPISLLDEIEVFKGSAEKTVSAVIPDDDNLGAILTMKDALSAGTYTVTLTPADEDEDPSSVEFEAKTANKATRIEILGDYLVMKNTDFNEGYCFIKGYNDFDEEVTLSGLTVNAAPSSSTQYDSSTGKLTVKSEQANQYAIIKQVTVYAQAMVDSKAIVAQKTLEVSSIGYPAEVEFGEITKDATNAPDISDGITINEINSGLYYIPLLSVKDNYGNEMLAKDLNDLDADNLLTTVPTSDRSLYFSVRDEGSVFTEKNGQVVVFLGQGNGKPGKFNFLMTSAGGQFEKEVNIIENPFIDTLDVTLPDIYEYEETEEFGLVAHDQDGNELDLYDYLQAGEFPNGKLEFIDQQNLTDSKTTIDAGNGNGKWRVQKFADTKTYKVTFVPSDQVKAKGIITFVTTTASFHTNTQMATVGARGTSGNISPELTKAATVGVDFNQALQFLDANGKKMDRAHNTQYPTFVQSNTKVVTATTDKAHTVNLTDEKIAAANHDSVPTNDFKFYYVVSKNDKVVDDTNKIESVTQGANAVNGVAATEGQYYVFLIASQDDDLADATKNTNDATKTRIIDSRTFYVSAKQAGDVPVSYTAKVSNKLYTGDKYADDVEVKVDITYRNGVVVKDQAASGLALNGGFKVKGNKISKGTATGDGTATVSVYLDKVAGTEAPANPGYFTNDGAVATCTLTYSDDDPVGTSVTFKRETQDPDGTKIYGTSWKEDETETVWDLTDNSVITVEDGELTMTNGNEAKDTYTMTVEDQYGETMKDAKYYVNGTQVPKNIKTFADGAAEKVLEIKGQSKGSEVSKTWRVNVPAGKTVTGRDTSVITTAQDVSVSDVTGLRAALDTAATTPLNITLTSSVTSDAAIAVPANSKLIVASGAMLTMNTGHALSTAGNGEIINNGVISLSTGDASIAAAAGKFTNNGVVNADVNDITVNGQFINNGTVTGTGGTISGTGTYTNNEGAVTNLAGGSTINMSEANTLKNAGTVKAGTISGYVEIEDTGAITEAAAKYDATTIVPAGVDATVKEGTKTLTIDNEDGSAPTTVAITNMTTVTVITGDADITGTTDGTTASTITTTGTDEAVVKSGYVTSNLKTAIGDASNASDFVNDTCKSVYVVYTAPVATKNVFVYSATINGKTYTWYEVGGSAKAAGTKYASGEDFTDAYFSSSWVNAASGTTKSEILPAITNALAEGGTGFDLTVSLYAANSYEEISSALLFGTATINCTADKAS